MNEQEQGRNERDFAARRRVIRGLAGGVPAVMTLMSGAAQANASSLQCIVRLPSPTVSLNQSLTVGGPDLADCRLLSDPTVAPVVPQPTGSPDIVYDTGPGTAMRKESLVHDGNKACVVFVDQNGTYASETIDSSASTNDYPVTASCYTSFFVAP